MLDSPSEEVMPPREEDGETKVLEAAANAEDHQSTASNTANVSEGDADDETEEWVRLRCTSLRTEEIAERDKQKKAREQRRNRCADYPGLAFGSAAFGSETMMK
jgi:hypothetical protein